MALDTEGLQPLDTTGLSPAPAGESGDRGLDTTNLKPLDTSGLRPAGGEEGRDEPSMVAGPGLSGFPGRELPREPAEPETPESDRERRRAYADWREEFADITGERPEDLGIEDRRAAQTYLFDKGPMLSPEGTHLNRLESAGGSFARGVGQTIAGIPKGIALLSAPDPEVWKNLDRIDEGQPPVQQAPPMGGSAGVFAAGDPTFAASADPNTALYEQYAEAGEEERERIRQTLQERAEAATTNSELYQTGRSIDEWFAENFPTNPEFQDEFWAAKVPQALGSATSFLATSVFSRGALRPLGRGPQQAGTYAAPAATGAGLNSAELFEDALANDADIATALEAAGYGRVWGLSEAVPIGNLFNRLDRAGGGQVRRYLSRAMRQGTEEAVQEAFVGIMNDATAQGLYDPERGVWDIEARGEEATVGFTTGAILETLMTLALPGRRRGAPTPTDESGVPEGAVPGETLIGREEPPDAPMGERERARTETPPPMPGDVESPLPTDAIQQGRETIQDALGQQSASQILEETGFPPINSTVNLTTDEGAEVSGMVVDAWEEGGERGAKIQLDDGTVISEPFEALRGRVTVTGEVGEPGEEGGEAEDLGGVEDVPEDTTLGDGAQQPQPGTQAQVPTMITRDMKRQLRDLGYGDQEIRGMRPQQAWENIQAGQRPEGARDAGEVRGDAGPVQGRGAERPGGEVEGRPDLQRPAQEGAAAGDRQAQARGRAAEPEQVEGGLPEGWSEASPGGLATSPQGIVDRNIASGKWFAVPDREGAEPIDGFDTREEAIEALQSRETPEAEAPSQAPTEAARAPISRRDVEGDQGRDTAVTATGREVPVRYAVVEASGLVPSQRDDGRVNPDYPAELQPRDRSRAISAQQVQDIAQGLNPRLLDRSPRAADGAPIVAEDGVVESGNGRILAVRRAYREGMETAEQYRSYLAEQGYPVEGMNQPVLVRVREGQMEAGERAAFTREANERDTLGMSATERAMADAQALDDRMLDLYEGGDVDASVNRPFVRAFLDQVVGRNEQAGMIAGDGSMSQEATRRIEAALLAKAYGDADLVASLVESADTNIKAIGGALVDVSAAWAQMRADAQAGQIDPSMDQTANLLEAVRLIQRARRERRSIAEFVGQRDILSGSTVDPVAEGFLRLMFRNTRQWTNPAGRDRIRDALRFYLDQAGRAQPGVDLLGETAPEPGRLLEAARERQYGDEEAAEQQQDLLAQPAGRPGERDRPGGEGRDERPRPDAAQEGEPTPARAREEGAEAEGQVGDPRFQSVSLEEARREIEAAGGTITSEGMRTAAKPGEEAREVEFFTVELRQADGMPVVMRGVSFPTLRMDLDRWLEVTKRTGSPAGLDALASGRPQQPAGEQGQKIPEPQWWRDLTGAKRSDRLQAAGIRGTARTPWSRLTPEQQRRLDEQWGPAKPDAQGWRRIGTNQNGQPLFEDGRGVRSYTEGGARITESVGIIPGQGISVSPDERGPEFLTDEEGAQADTTPERRDQAQHDIYARRLEDIEDPAELRAYAEELRTALMTDERTGLGSNRSWLNRTPKAHIASIDLDSLKWVNDNMGHDAGDRLIEVVGDAFREAGIADDAFHVSGDEFYAHSEDEQRLREAMDRAREYLRGVTIEGNGLQFTGPGFSYGIGTSIERAEGALHGEKTAREEAGERAARGERPQGVAEAAQAPEQERTAGDREKAPEARPRERAERPEPRVAPDTGRALRPQTPQELVDDSDLLETTRANIAGETPERAALIVLRDMLEAGTDVMNDAQLPSEINAQAADLIRRINAALESDQSLDAIQEESVGMVREWLRRGDIETDIATELEAVENVIESQMALPAAEQPGQVEEQASDPETRRLADHFARAFADGRSFRSITEARREAGEVLGRTVEPGTQDAKRVDEAVELGVVLRAREIAREEAGNPRQAYGRLVDLYGSMPNLSTRTSTSVAQQAYSTPIPLAYLAARSAGITDRTLVYEPTAGNGALLVTADPANVLANELNPERAANLQDTLPGASVTSNNAAEWSPRGQYDVVIANPPFGPVKDEGGRTRRFQVNDRYETAEIDHAIAMNALESMRDDGSAVLLVGSVAKTARSEDARSDAYNGKAKREFYLTLYGEYNVVDHFTVAGELYEKQGAGWPVDVIVIRGRGPSDRRVPAADPPRIYESWDDLGEVLDAEYPSPAPVDRTADRDRDRGEREPRPGDGRDRADRGAPRPDRQRGEPASGEPAGVREGPVDRQPGDTRPAEPAAREPARPAEGERPANRPRRAPVTAEGENLRQVTYQPSSTTSSMGTLVPVNMQTSVQNALDGLQARVGDIDHYVATRLDYRPDELRDYFGAEQIDAIALALDNMEHGAGFIIGDQTGIGKGRVVAAVIRHALRQGKTPIFVTEKPNLYGDMYRDLGDIAVPDMLGHAPRILMTNAAQTVPLDEQGNTLKTGSAARHNELLSSMAASGRLEGYDMVFTTYSQMQTLRGETTPRMRFLEAVGRNAIVVFDESHNAGGSVQQGRGEEREGQQQEMNRATFARNLARSASGVLYSSATYAKRPEVMDLYATTDMRLAVSDISNLAEAIQRGGVPMQQVVASMLSESGQYLRRERSFDGVVYNAPVVNVPRQTYGQYSQALARIQDFSERIVSKAVKALDKDLKAEGKAISTDGATGGAGATSTNFTSIMHNLIDQMLLSIKADVAAEKAIQAIGRDEKPVITVANTMGSFIHDYVEDLGIKPGDRVDLTFNALLERYLDRTRWITMRRPFMKKGEKGERKYLTDSEIGPSGVRIFNEVRDMIRNMDLSGLPVSPIDHIRMRLQQAGYQVGEITGRTATLDYRPDGTYYRARPGKEVSIAGRRNAIADFNGGSVEIDAGAVRAVDAMIINQAGSTGLSLHASETFKDKRKRRMILAQAEKNIDTHMQMLGRVHRTGQVVEPEYDQLVADVPAEKRPASVLAKKMASLNANTTASRGGAMMAEDVPDFMNQYGDEVAARVMADMPEIHHALGRPLKDGTEGYEVAEAMRKVTGRIPLLPIEQQEMIYEMLESEYRALIEQKEAAGESVLEAKTLDLDARVENRRQVVAPEGADSPFADGVYVEAADVKRLGKPHPTDRVIEMVGEELGIDPSTLSADNMQPALEAGREAANRMLRETDQSFQTYRRETLDEIETDATRRATESRLQGNMDRFRSILQTTPVGRSVRLLTDAGNLYGVVTRIHRTGKAKNPVALGSWKVTVAVTDASRQLTIPMSQLFTRDTAPSSPGENQVIIERADTMLEGMPVIRAFDDMQTETRETRTIITGNILAGFDHVGGRGAIINFTDSEGGVRQGILMPRDYEYDKDQQERPVDFRSADQVLAFIDRGHTVRSTDNAVEVTQSGERIRFEVASAKDRGGRYYLDPGILEAAGADFVRVGGRMRLEAERDVAPSVIDEMKRAGAGFRATDNLGVAREIAGSVSGEVAPEEGPEGRFQLREAFTGDVEQVTSDLQSRLQELDIADRVALRLRERIQAVAEGKASEADGRYLRGVIEVSLTAPDATRTLNHEAIHALRDLGLIRDAEWRTLKRTARADTERMEGIRRRYERMGLPEDAMVEEAVADMYADWAADRSESRGFARRAFERIRDFLRALGNALAGRGYRTADSVFRSVDRGEVGRRQPRDARGRFTADISTVREPGARFALSDPRANDPTAKDGTVARQKATNQWIGSQPLDQAMRLPFHIFGGINEHGEWKWGKTLHKRAEHAIVNAKFSDEGRFHWINPTLERARAGLIDRYGLDPAYVERERLRGLEQSQLMLQGEEHMRALQEANVGPDEARVLQAVLTGEAVADADMAKLAEPIRNAIDDMGREAVNLGLISAEAFERNRGSYLHRVYLKHETDQGGLSRFVARMAGRQRKKIIGNQFKGRGLWIEVDPGRMMRRIPGFREGERGTPTEGERFRVLDKVEHEGQGTLRDIDPASQRKVLDRMYLPADAAVPEHLGDYVDRGIWEVRGAKGGNVVLWRDFTKAERESMGEIVDARYTIAKTYMMMSHDLATGRFFRDIAMNEDWATTQKPRDGTWLDAQEYNRFWADPSIEWVRVPDTTIPKSNTKRYGALGGTKKDGKTVRYYVRAEIWRDLHELENMQKANWWNEILTQWKLNKTARSPVVHTNNIMSNVVLMDLADVRAVDLVQGIVSMIRQDQHYQDARDHGAFGADMVSQEIRKNVLQPILEEIQRDVQGGQDTIESKIGLVGKLADAIWSRAKGLDRKMIDLYRLEDEVFRMATYMRKLSLGFEPNQAALEARDQFLNYDIRAPWVNAARRSVLPFISYTYRAVPIVARSVALRPWKLAKYTTIAYAVSALGYMLEPGDEDEERRSLREHETGYTWIGAPRMIRTPYSDEYGNPVFLDVRRWVPAGDVFDMNQGHSAFPIPAPLQFGGPLALGAEWWLNKRSFTGDEIINDRTDDWWDKTSAVADWGWKSWMPSAAWIPGSWYWERIGNAAAGGRDWQGRPYSLREAVPSSFGVKLKPQDVEEGFFWKGIEFDRVERELKAELRRAHRDHDRNLISASQLAEKERNITRKLENLGEERQRTFEGTAP